MRHNGVKLYQQRTKLAITRSIIIGDARRLQEELEPVRNMWGLSKALEELNPDKYDARSINAKLSALEKEGQRRIDRYFVADLCHILHVSSEELHRI